MADMRDRLIELLCRAHHNASCVIAYDGDEEKAIEEEARYLLANGVILPPCKVGDTVYYIAFGKVYKGECHAITLKPTMQIHLYDYDGDNASIKADGVFLTREEAEKALKGEIDMSNITWCYFCAHSNTNRRSGDQIRCIKKHKYVAEHSTCEEYQDKSLERLAELFFKEKENG